MAKQNLNKNIKEIIKAASKGGADTHLFYVTTLNRYQTLVSLMENLKAEIAKHGTFIEKEYVKGRPNIVVNPAITEYNKLSSTANQTIQTLIRVVEAVESGSILNITPGDDEL